MFVYKHTPTPYTHTSHTPQVYNQTYNYTQIPRRVLREITRVIKTPATGASQSLYSSTRWETHQRLFREPIVPECEIRVERYWNVDGRHLHPTWTPERSLWAWPSRGQFVFCYLHGRLGHRYPGRLSDHKYILDSVWIVVLNKIYATKQDSRWIYFNS